METDLNTPEGLEAFIDQQLQPPAWPRGWAFEEYLEILRPWVAEGYPELPKEDQIRQTQYLVWEQFREASLEDFCFRTGWDLDEPPVSPVEPRRAPESFEEAPDLDSALDGLRGPVWRSWGDSQGPYSNALKADVICDYLLQALEHLGEVETRQGKRLYETLADIVDRAYGTK